MVKRDTDTGDKQARRTQAERRTETRERLLSAAIDSIVEVGYSATTVRGVATRAQVSTGAATHHFPHRGALIASVVDRLSERRVAGMSAAAERVVSAATGSESSTDGLQARLDVLRSAFSGPLFGAWIRLWIAAVGDPELHAHLSTAERQVSAAVRDAARQLLQRGDDPAFGGRLVVVLSTLTGLGIREQFEPRVHGRRVSLWPAHRAALQVILTAPADRLQLPD